MFVLPISTLLWSAVNDVAMLAFTLFTSDTSVFNLSWCNTLKGPSLLSTLVYVREKGLPLISILTPGYWIAEHFCLNAKNDKSRQIAQTYLAEVCWALNSYVDIFNDRLYEVDLAAKRTTAVQGVIQASKHPSKKGSPAKAHSGDTVQYSKRTKWGDETTHGQWKETKCNGHLW